MFLQKSFPNVFDDPRTHQVYHYVLVACTIFEAKYVEIKIFEGKKRRILRPYILCKVLEF